MRGAHDRVIRARRARVMTIHMIPLTEDEVAEMQTAALINIRLVNEEIEHNRISIDVAQARIARLRRILEKMSSYMQSSISTKCDVTS